jgi:hypothetical protein
VETDPSLNIQPCCDQSAYVRARNARIRACASPSQRSACRRFRSYRSAVVHHLLPERHREGRKSQMDEIKLRLTIPIGLNNISSLDPEGRKMALSKSFSRAPEKVPKKDDCQK